MSFAHIHNQNNYFVQFNLHFRTDPETNFTLKIDPRNYFTSLKEQIRYYSRNPDTLKYWTEWAKQELNSNGTRFKQTHIPNMCAATKTGFRACVTDCPYVHHLPLYYALQNAPTIPTPPPKKIPVIAAAKPEKPQEPWFLRLPPLKIDVEVPQPITKLNEETDREE